MTCVDAAAEARHVLSDVAIGDGVAIQRLRLGGQLKEFVRPLIPVWPRVQLDQRITWTRQCTWCARPHKRTGRDDQESAAIHDEIVRADRALTRAPRRFTEDACA